MSTCEGGSLRSIASIVSVTICEMARSRNHLWFAGMTYSSPHSQLAPVGRSNGNYTLDLPCLSIASSSSSSDRVDIPSVRNPGRLSEAVVSIFMSST